MSTPGFVSPPTTIAPTNLPNVTPPTAAAGGPGANGGNVATPIATIPPTPTPPPPINGTMITPAALGNNVGVASTNPVMIAVPAVLLLLGIGGAVAGVILLRKRSQEQQVTQATRERMFSSFEPTRAPDSTSTTKQEPVITPSPLTTITITPVHVPYNDDSNTDWQAKARPRASSSARVRVTSKTKTHARAPSSATRVRFSSNTHVRASSVSHSSPSPSGSPINGSPISTRTSVSLTSPPPQAANGSKQQPEMDQGDMDGMGPDEEKYESSPRWQSQMASIPEDVEPQVTPARNSPRQLTRSPMSCNKPLPAPPLPTEFDVG